MEDPLREILDRAEQEGVALGVRWGRLAFRGASPSLREALLANERRLVERLGGRFRSPLAWMSNDVERGLRWWE